MTNRSYPFLIDPPLFLAPMAGVTDLPTRLIMRKSGAAMAFTEMVSAKGLVMKNDKTFNIISSDSSDSPLGIQLFGADPEIMAEAAGILEENGAKLIDINMGCPVKKVVKTFSGAYLMKDRQRAEKILKMVVNSVSIPITVKIRSGWDSADKENGAAVELSKIAEFFGVSAVTVHGRTAMQGYSGKADWKVIADVKKSVSIPVIGNGDIKSTEDCIKMIKSTGCNGVMIGRASIGNPWIFKKCADFFKGNPISEILNQEKCNLISDHFNLMIDYYGERIGIKKMRSHLIQYAKGYSDSSKFRAKIVHMTNKNEIESEIKNFFI